MASYRELIGAPILSSQARGWVGISAELFLIDDCDVVAPHEQHLVSVNLEGGARLYQRRDGREEERAVAAGEVIITPAGTPKRWRRVGRGQVLVIALDPDFMDRTLRSGTGSARSFELLDNFGTRDGVIEAIGASVLEELRGEMPGSGVYVEAMATQLVFRLARHYCVERRGGAPKASLSARHVGMAREYIEAHIADDLTVERIAAFIGCSPTRFAHGFKAATGVPPHKYIMERRLQRAKALLRGSELSVSEIAPRLGYSSPSHFCVSFRTAVRMSPTAYRART